MSKWIGQDDWVARIERQALDDGTWFDRRWAERWKGSGDPALGELFWTRWRTWVRHRTVDGLETWAVISNDEAREWMQTLGYRSAVTPGRLDGEV